MANLSRKAPAMQAALRRLGNPYASLQAFDLPDDSLPRSDFEPLSLAEREYVRRQGNQYATLSIAKERGTERVVQAEARAGSQRGSVLHQPISKIHFRNGCRRVFRGYIPAIEKGRLREHHRDFISRNEARPAEVRGALLKRIQRYDLSDLRGLQARFNRERLELTDAALRKLESQVLDELKGVKG